MASREDIREAALYLECFLKGMSECSIIGSYTVQFMEMNGFSLCLQTSFATHLLRLVKDMKGLLMKMDSSLLLACHVGIQTDEVQVCPMCNNDKSSDVSLKGLSLNNKESLGDTQEEKAFDPPELVQLLTSTPLIELKQEITCGPDPVTPSTSQYQGVEISVTDVEFKDIKSKGMGSENVCEESEMGKCVLAGSLDDTMDLDYVSSTDLGHNAQEEILLDELAEGEDGQADKLMYSVYTMNSCGSLQLVSRVLSRSSTTKGTIEAQQVEVLDNSDSTEEAVQEQVHVLTQAESVGDSVQEAVNVLTQSESRSESVEESFDVLSQPGSRKDVMEPVERATIKIKCMKQEDDRLEAAVETLIEREDTQASGSDAVQEMVVSPDLPDLEEKPFKKPTKKCIKKAGISDRSSSNTIITTDIVKLGPEDLAMKNYWCGVCEKEYPSAGSLKIHLSRAHSQVKWCYTCTKTIGVEDTMCDHVRECHGDLPFICEICGRSFRSNAAFQRHMDIHGGLRGSACEICGRTFSRTEYYREHKRIHTGEKPYKCNTCSKSFSRSSNLNTHMRIHSSAEGLHTCNMCKKSFTRRDKLKDHMIRHWQIKRYACRLCPKAYSEKRDLTRHLLKMHTDHNNLDT
ncbi:hypothetical protein Pcinc_026070 [Petrolisthes cinctipes]|uniref:C2H2-type domain-containing protein n=1 Tax=Petrolisthes cinctipes TaxID=88211 RepID=A0AAE1F802_PETCI|nr:hypothetical protein Pcinc_026070 [Petrolisthes cinctipes]